VDAADTIRLTLNEDPVGANSFYTLSLSKFESRQSADRHAYVPKDLQMCTFDTDSHYSLLLNPKDPVSKSESDIASFTSWYDRLTGRLDDELYHLLQSQIKRLNSESESGILFHSENVEDKAPLRNTLNALAQSIEHLKLAHRQKLETGISPDAAGLGPSKNAKRGSYEIEGSRNKKSRSSINLEGDSIFETDCPGCHRLVLSSAMECFDSI
jgi:hypothetical protein